MQVVLSVKVVHQVHNRFNWFEKPRASFKQFILFIAKVVIFLFFLSYVIDTVHIVSAPIFLLQNE
ncbi:hypothetical protein BMB171_C2295 [Bacillus thuringiensis BMB171]|nr:hypothetical protein BMB171_C2295 [Bacillus thuringiensis BMB171]